MECPIAPGSTVSTRVAGKPGFGSVDSESCQDWGWGVGFVNALGWCVA